MEALIVLNILLFFCVEIYSNVATFDSLFKWEKASISSLNKTYLPYELCLALLDPISDSDSHGNNECLTKHNYPNHLPKICTLGNSYWTKGGLFPPRVSVGLDKEPCLNRNISMRDGLRSTWSPLNEIEYNITNLLNTLKEINSHYLLFIGDSMSEQMAKFLACDLSRLENVTVAHDQQLFGYRVIKHLSADFDINGYNIHVGFLYLEMKCHFFETSTILHKTDACSTFIRNVVSGFVRSSTRDSPAVITFNYGLHIHDDNTYLMKSIAHALLLLAKRSRRRYFILFRESSSQHFAQRVHGYYDGAKLPTSSSSSSQGTSNTSPLDLPYCCNEVPKSNLTAGDWRNQGIKENLQLLDPRWKNYVGWIPFLDYSNELFDLHVDSNQHGDTDCTHLFYIPNIGLPIWVHTTKELERLYHSDVFPITNITYFNGEMLQGGGRAIYMVENGYKRLFTRWEAFEATGKKTFDVEKLLDEDLQAIPDGPEIS